MSISHNLSATAYTLAILLTVAGSITLLIHFDTQRNKLAYPETEESRYLASLEIHSWEDVGLDTVAYTYFGEALPEKLYEDELVDRRTEKSVQRFVRQIDKDHREIQAIFYTVPVHARDSQGVWRKLVRATTTVEAWQAKPLSLRESVMAFWVPVARAFGPTGGAGYINSYSVSPTTCGIASTNARNATVGTAATLGSGVAGMQLNDYVGVGCDADIYRTWIPFDTSDIPSAFPITSASMGINITSSIDNFANNRTFYLSTTSQATHSTLTTDDFEQMKLGFPGRINTGGTDHIVSDGFTGSHTYDIDPAYLYAIRRNGETSTCSATAGITCLGIAMASENLATGDGDSPISFIFFGVGDFSSVKLC